MNNMLDHFKTYDLTIIDAQHVEPQQDYVALPTNSGVRGKDVFSWFVRVHVSVYTPECMCVCV